MKGYRHYKQSFVLSHANDLYNYKQSFVLSHANDLCNYKQSFVLSHANDLCDYYNFDYTISTNEDLS